VRFDALPAGSHTVRCEIAATTRLARVGAPQSARIEALPDTSAWRFDLALEGIAPALTIHRYRGHEGPGDDLLALGVDLHNAGTEPLIDGTIECRLSNGLTLVSGWSGPTHGGMAPGAHVTTQPTTPIRPGLQIPTTPVRASCRVEISSPDRPDASRANDRMERIVAPPTQ
jgi:hypothetical protein